MVTYKELKEEHKKKVEELKIEHEKRLKEAELEFNAKVKELQANCKHPTISVIMTSGQDKKEKVCEICNAVVKKAKMTIHVP